jgi:hypothetical protein
MKPSQLASQLHRIASKIEASKNPDRTLVARDLKQILAAVAEPAKPAKLISIQLETSHHNSSGVAWYAYFKGEQALPPSEEFIEAAMNSTQERLSLEEYDPSSWEEVPSTLSRGSGLRRYYVGGAG